MRPNVLKFKEEIKTQVAKQKEQGYCDYWMHPMYCAYYLIKHNIENPDAYIQEDIKKSYKALHDEYSKKSFQKKVEEWYIKYESETVCSD